ncbi:MAG: DUF4139 domain-containing protein [Treponema sp.]|nr:DUF4139 domain-containing protein [Treponema sp.]
MPETTKSILAKNPEIMLASSSNALLEEASAFFNLGKLFLEANKRLLVKLEEGKTPYTVARQWDANRQERPFACLRAPTPLKTMSGQVEYSLNSAGIIYDTGLVSVSPDRPFDLHIGEQPGLVTYKSIITAEFPERKNLPFTHSLEYSVENQSGKSVFLEIAIPVSYGVNHRAEYHFTKVPDERPGNRMIWKYTLAPGEKAALQFSYDAEMKDDPSYRQFDYSEGGR